VSVVGKRLNPSVMPWRETPWHLFVKAGIYMRWLWRRWHRRHDAKEK